VAGNVIGKEGDYRGIGIYDLTSRTYDRITESGSDPIFLPDSRRLLFPRDSDIVLVDRQTREQRKILSLPPDQILSQSLSLTADGRTLYFSRGVTEADLWLITLE